jgi:LL-diaminopimelate aminotransferase
MKIQSAKRLVQLPPYVFAALGARITELRAQGKDVIRLDLGSPDLPPTGAIVDALKRSAEDPTHHGYTAYGGTPAWKEAIAKYYARRFAVDLDPVDETLCLIGSKEGIFNIALAYVDPGDTVLVPDPSYPTYSVGAQLAGGDLFQMPLLERNQFMPDLDAIPVSTARRAKLMWINYPNNPTTTIATLQDLAHIVEFCKLHEILLCHDNPYADVTFDGFVAPSVLQVPGAREIAVEFNSLSKAYNMGGWRVGMVVGNRDVIRDLARLKSNIDSSHFQPVIDASVAAMSGDQEWLYERNEVYRERRDIVMAGLEAAGLRAQTPRATIYVWARVLETMTSAEYASFMLEEAGVSVTPGSAFGQHGEGYVRISLGIATPRVREAMERMARARLSL